MLASYYVAGGFLGREPKKTRPPRSMPLYREIEIVLLIGIERLSIVPFMREDRDSIEIERDIEIERVES
jgi:hypothetical protein